MTEIWKISYWDSTSHTMEERYFTDFDSAMGFVRKLPNHCTSVVSSQLVVNNDGMFVTNIICAIR